MRWLFRLLVVAKIRNEDEHDARISQAWATASLMRAKKIPALATLLTKQRRRPQTVNEQRVMLNMLSQAYGIPLKKGAAGGR